MTSVSAGLEHLGFQVFPALFQVFLSKLFGFLGGYAFSRLQACSWRWYISVACFAQTLNIRKAVIINISSNKNHSFFLLVYTNNGFFPIFIYTI